MFSISEIEEYDSLILEISLILLGLFSVSESGQQSGGGAAPGGEGEDDAHLPSVVGVDEAQPYPAIPPQRRGEDSWAAATSSSARPIVRNRSVWWAPVTE
jgi:hypothetical protein